MRVYLKKQSAIQLDDAPVRMLRLIESTKEKIKTLESQETVISERLNQSAGEASWLRRQLSSGELILKDAPKIDEAESDVKLHQASLKRIARDLKSAKASLAKMIASFNASWLEIDASDEIK